MTGKVENRSTVFMIGIIAVILFLYMWFGGDPCCGDDAGPRGIAEVSMDPDGNFTVTMTAIEPVVEADDIRLIVRNSTDRVFSGRLSRLDPTVGRFNDTNDDGRLGKGDSVRLIALSYGGIVDTGMTISVLHTPTGERVLVEPLPFP